MKSLRILLVIILFFGLSQGSHAAILLDRVVAVVNQEVITWSDLYKAMEFEAGDKLRELNEDEKRKIFKENEAVFLDTLIDMKLQVQAAKQMGIDAAQEDITDAINEIKKKYSLDDRAMMESLKKEGFTLEEYRKKIGEQIILNKVVSQQVRNRLVVSDADIEKYISENKGVVEEGESYRIRQIFFKKPATVSERKTLEEKAGAVLQELKAGGDFASLAMKYSYDPSRKAGGDLGFIMKRLMAGEFIDVVSRMKVGDVSQPFWTEKGLHIIKLEEKTEKQSKAEIRESVKNRLMERQFSEKYKGWIRSLRENAYLEIRL